MIAEKKEKIIKYLINFFGPSFSLFNIFSIRIVNIIFIFKMIFKMENLL